MSEATLLLGIGATKAGTSWLHRYLANHPECHLRSIKELHFFDTIEQGSTDWYLNNFGQDCKRLERQIGDLAFEEAAARARQVADIRVYMKIMETADQAGYLDYLDEGRTSQRLNADITPCYSLLSEGCFERMAGMSSDVRFVFLMRDPVERLWSHVRMIAKRRSKTGRDIERRAGRIFERALSGGETHITDRGDYIRTLDRITAAIDPRKLFTAFYEELFSAETLDKLCAFLGISPRAGLLTERVHAGVPVAMTSDQRSQAVRYLRPQYDYVAARYGRLPREWEANRAGA